MVFMPRGREVGGREQGEGHEREEGAKDRIWYAQPPVCSHQSDRLRRRFFDVVPLQNPGVTGKR